MTRGNCVEKDSDAEAMPSQKEGYDHLAMSAKIGGHPLLAHIFAIFILKSCKILFSFLL